MNLPSHLSTRIQYQHKALVDLIDGLSIEMVRRHVVPGKWSIFENIVHLQTYQHFFLDRINLILEKENPVFERYTADADPLFLDNCGKTTREIMQDLIRVRKDMAAAMLAYPESVFIRKGTHPKFGTMTLLQWINFFLLHEAHHLFAIFKLRVELQQVITE
ncbi:MAG: DinB family protein [Chitinophagaceae bacterium]